MGSKVLIVTSSSEPAVSGVIALLERKRVPVVRINTDVDFQDHFSFQVGGRTDWLLDVAGNIIINSDIRSVWYRRPELPQTPGSIDPIYRSFIEEETKRCFWSLWTSIPVDQVLWVNHPLTTRLLESNKPLQLQIADGCGLLTPETMITNNPQDAFAAFERWGGEMIIKTFGSRTNDLNGKGLAVYTSRVTRENLGEYAEEIRLGPVFLQRYIPKEIELRITIVGENVFTCAIHSQDSPMTVDDWRRYDFERVRHERYQLPDVVREKMLRVMNELHLVFGAADMIVTPSGEYVFLEVNPSGQWGWIEAITGLPISEAIASLLGQGISH